MNLNELARAIALKETGKKEVSIAQIKEIIRLLSIELVNSEKVEKNLKRLGTRSRKIKDL